MGILLSKAAPGWEGERSHTEGMDHDVDGSDVDGNDVDGNEDDPTGGAPGQDRAGRRFGRTRLKPGYRVADVDALMERAEAGLVTTRDVETVSFGSTRGSEGYDEVEVDTALDALASRLRAEGRPGEDAPAGEAKSWWSRLLSRDG